ncbi:MAG: hypothetical protein HYR63_08095 [Proteobacteria bacterium]|nr:hypothetical protein [Pseudomonadota bacterium]MBI3499774.1 hypothetical protein [Pseudomonadota bacterium]
MTRTAGQHLRPLTVVGNDRESETRTPARALHPIPPDALDAYSPCPPLPSFRLGGEADLTRIAPGRPPADGTKIRISGRILDGDERPARRVLMEIWNCNAYGRYSHTDDVGSKEAKLDPNFHGFGRLMTDDDGRFCFWTIKPAAYIARPDIGWWRPPHVHYSILGGGVRLVTQMYFPGDALNERDFIYLAIPEPDRPLALAIPAGAEAGVPGFRFDMVVRGRHQTPPDRD